MSHGARLPSVRSAVIPCEAGRLPWAFEAKAGAPAALAARRVAHQACQQPGFKAPPSFSLARPLGGADAFGDPPHFLEDGKVLLTRSRESDKLSHRQARPTRGRPESGAGSSGTPRPGSFTLGHGHHQGQNPPQGEQPEL